MVRPRHLAALVALALAPILALAQPSLAPRGFVNDFAGALRPETRARLDALGLELREKTGAEIAVAVVRSLDDETVEDYALRLADSWRLGGPDDRGALLLVALDDRRLRLEVGYGLEPILPDGRAGEILDGMTPLLRANRLDDAVVLGWSEAARVVAADAGVELTGLPARAPPAGEFRISTWITIAILLALVVTLRRRRRRLWDAGPISTSWTIGGGGGSMSFGGGFSSGGGFGGFRGGGGFGGGGASRGW